MNWGWKIFFTFIAFAFLMGFMVFKCMQQDVALVDDHYYEKELKFQQQIDKMDNYAALEKPLQLQYDKQNASLKIDWPTANVRDASVDFFRPSDARMDRTFELKDPHQALSLTDLPKGYWKLKMSWKHGDKSYYKEESFVMP